MTQQEAVIKYLKTHKKATGIDFVTKLGILCYTKRLSEIRHHFAPANGYKLVTSHKMVDTRYGKARIVFYSLVKVGNKNK